MLHIIIENEEAYHFCRRGRFAKDEITWHTTSPWLLEKLSQLGEKVISLEEKSLLKDRSDLCFATMDIADNVAAYLDTACQPFSQNILMGRVMRRELQVICYVLMYKGMLLTIWHEEFGHDSRNKLKVVGNTQMTFLQTCSLSVGRFDTLFAVIAAALGKPDIEVIAHQASSGQDVLKKINKEEMSKTEKALHFLNTDLSTLLFYVWASLQKRKILKTNTLQLGKGDRTIFFLRRCELLYETFLPFLKKGVRIVGLNPRFDSDNKKAEGADLNQEELRGVFKKEFEEAMASRGITFNKIYEACANLLTERVSTLIQYEKDVVDKLPAYYEMVRKHRTDHSAVVTNVLMRPSERIFQQYLIKNNIPVFSMEHGVAAGLEGKTEGCHHRLDCTDGDDYMICYSEASRHLHCIDRGRKEGIAAGVPFTNKKIAHFWLQRILARWKLNLKHDERAVFYLALVARNNWVVGPKFYTDLEFYQTTKSIACDILSSIKGKSVFKLYPATRYLDPDPFGEIIPLPAQVEVVQYFEFSLLRPAADVVILSSTQSAFGWACSIPGPVIFIEMPSVPLFKDIKGLVKDGLFHIDAAKSGWQDEVKKLLELPHKEFLKLWAAKKEARQKLLTYIFGPEGNTGQRAADYIIEKMDQPIYKGRSETPQKYQEVVRS